jgi:hypothetical protein
MTPEQLEERLLAEELRELQQRRGSGSPRDTVRDRPEMSTPNPNPNPSPRAPEPELEELSADDLLLDDEGAANPAAAAAASPAEQSARLRIDEFDEDSEVKPVVLLSPKRKPAQPRAGSEGAFMSDLERRLREDLES